MHEFLSRRTVALDGFLHTAAQDVVAALRPRVVAIALYLHLADIEPIVVDGQCVTPLC